MKQTIVLALGGNAIQGKGERGTYGEQLANVTKTMESVIPIIRDDRYRVVITHGNGPQVGNLMIQQAQASRLLPEMPMHMCGAMSQGQIGYLIQSSLNNLLNKAGIAKNVVTVVTQTAVDRKSAGFRIPSKPVGPYYSKDQAEKIAKAEGFVFKEDAGRGYRRVVPSPRPLRIVEMETIRKLVSSGTLVIASGGGGIPVVEVRGILSGVDAVIDKDRAAALLATELKASMLIILTAVENVCINFGKPDETKLDALDIKQAETYMDEGHFVPGSMGPKIEAAVDFLKANKTGKVIITHAHSLPLAFKGKSGTVITY